MTIAIVSFILTINNDDNSIFWPFVTIIVIVFIQKLLMAVTAIIFHFTVFNDNRSNNKYLSSSLVIIKVVSFVLIPSGS